MIYKNKMKILLILLLSLLSSYAAGAATRSEDERYSDDHHRQTKSLKAQTRYSVVDHWIHQNDPDKSNRNNDHVTRLSFCRRAISSLESTQLKDIDFLIKFPNLTSLDLSTNSELVSIAPLVHLRLRKLDVSQCSKVRDFELLGQITTLEDLSLCGAFDEDDVPYPGLDFIGHLTRLRKLDLSSNDSLSTLAPLGILPHLTELNLDDVKSATDLSPIGLITTLRFLNIQYVPLVENIDFLTKLTNLEVLIIGDKLKLPLLSSTVTVYQ